MQWTDTIKPPSPHTLCLIIDGLETARQDNDRLFSRLMLKLHLQLVENVCTFWLTMA